MSDKRRTKTKKKTAQLSTGLGDADHKSARRAKCPKTWPDHRANRSAG